MTEVELKYNPYNREKTLTIAGESITGKNLCNFCGANGTELSEWCNIFFEKLFASENDDITVNFSGIERDYEFLDGAKDEFMNKHSDIRVYVNKHHIYAIEDKMQGLKDLFNKMQEETPFPSLKDEQVTKLFKRATDSDCEMAVVATMSSGKSTLINALLGSELLPARNEATTATIARIHDVDGSDHFKGTSYDADNNVIEEYDPLTAEAMESLNDIDKHPTSRIEIYGDIEGIESKNIQLVLTDTPGPNNSRTAEHQKHTYDLLNSDYKPMLLYVLNGTQLETNDDDSLLHDVAKAMKAGDRQSRDRFIFILNKADEFDPEKGELISKKIDDVKVYLAKHGIENARVFPCASRLAKLIRQKEHNDPRLTRRESSNISNDAGWFIDEEKMHLSDYADFLSPDTEKEFRKQIEEAKAGDDELKEAIFYTGIPSVEFAISEYLSKYALPAKISLGVNSFKDKIDNLGIEAEENNALKGNTAKVEELKKNLEEIKNIFAKGDKANELRQKIDSFSADKQLKDAFAKARTNFMDDFTRTSNSMSHEVDPDLARRYIDRLENTIPEMVIKFHSNVEQIINTVLLSQAEECVNEYKNYISDLVGDVSVDTNPAAIFGDVASISVGEVLSDFERTKSVKVGEHQERNQDYHFGDGIANIFRSLVGKEKKKKFLTYEDFEDVSYVDFRDLIQRKFKPIIDNFANETRNTMDDFAQQQQADLKESFKNKFNELDQLLKDKVHEQEESLKDTEKFNAMIEKNKERLNWLNSFKAQLDNLLALED